MSRRIANAHKLAKGVWKHVLPKAHIHTSSSKARVYFAYPPEGGWKGGEPEKNGYKG